jgi:Rod binding domain-containing protein
MLSKVAKWGPTEDKPMHSKDEDGYADILDAQLHSIKGMGISAYLTQQLRVLRNSQGCCDWIS